MYSNRPHNEQIQTYTLYLAIGVEICERIKHTTKQNKPLCIKLELEINKREKGNNNNWSMTFKTLFIQNESTTAQ